MSLDSIVSIVTAATDRTLLTIEDLREAVDAPDHSQDAELLKLGIRVANRISRACRLRAGGATPPTLRQETIMETFRHRHGGGFHQHFAWRGPHRLRLARRPIVSIDTLSFDGVSQDVDALLIDASAGMIEYLPGRGGFSGNAIMVQYKAGWAIIPEDLKLAAIMLLQQYNDTMQRETGLRTLTIPEVIERQYWNSATPNEDGDIPQSIMDMLSPYRNEE